MIQRDRYGMAAGIVARRKVKGEPTPTHGAGLCGPRRRNRVRRQPCCCLARFDPRTAQLLSEPQRQCLEVFVPADPYRSRRYSFGVSPVQRLKACRKLTASLNPSVNATSSVLSRVVVK